MKALQARIGNSRGVRLSKPVIEPAGLSDEFKVVARDGAVVITGASQPRSGWADAARQMRVRADDRLLDGTAPGAAQYTLIGRR